MKTRFILFAVLAIVATSCNFNASKSKKAAKEASATVEYFGTYEGTMPAADAGGVKTVLKINQDSTYYLRGDYVGKDSLFFEESGMYTVQDGKLFVLTAPSSGDKTYYVVVDGGLMLSDSLGTVTDSELAELYILKKQ